MTYRPEAACASPSPEPRTVPGTRPRAARGIVVTELAGGQAPRRGLWDFAHPQVRGGVGLADARARRDRTRVVFAGPFPDACELADGAGTGVGACLFADARTFRHGPVAIEAGSIVLATVLGDGALLELTGGRTMASPFTHRARVAGAGRGSNAAVLGHRSGVVHAGAGAAAACGLAHGALVGGAGEVALTAVLGDVAGVEITCLSAHACTRSDGAGVAGAG